MQAAVEKLMRRIVGYVGYSRIGVYVEASVRWCFNQRILYLFSLQRLLRHGMVIDLPTVELMELICFVKCKAIGWNRELVSPYPVRVLGSDLH